MVEEESYFLELVRYLHLNPLRAKVVPTLRALDRYPWTGHSALLGYRPCPWQATGAVLQEFAPTLVRTRKAYRTFVVDGIPLGRRAEFQGGGLVRSLEGWRAVAVPHKIAALSAPITMALSRRGGLVRSLEGWRAVAVPHKIAALSAPITMALSRRW